MYAPLQARVGLWPSAGFCADLTLPLAGVVEGVRSGALLAQHLSTGVRDLMTLEQPCPHS